eukprot:5598816-Pleurochrysis_carterae.AAC.1
MNIHVCVPAWSELARFVERRRRTLSKSRTEHARTACKAGIHFPSQPTQRAHQPVRRGAMSHLSSVVRSPPMVTARTPKSSCFRKRRKSISQNT